MGPKWKLVWAPNVFLHGPRLLTTRQGCQITSVLFGTNECSFLYSWYTMNWIWNYLESFFRFFWFRNFCFELHNFCLQFWISRWTNLHCMKLTKYIIMVATIQKGVEMTITTIKSHQKVCNFQEMNLLILCLKRKVHDIQDFFKLVPNRNDPLKGFWRFCVE